jgi:hypothetical protein
VQLKTPLEPIGREVEPSTVSVNWFVIVSSTPLWVKAHAPSEPSLLG